jgi:hypothetical protein
MRAITALFLLMVLLAPPPALAVVHHQHIGHHSGPPPNGATAKCNDGSWSFARRQRDACKNHGGIYLWLPPPPAE